MNSLSWTIYAANVLPNFSAAFGFISIMGALTFAGALVVSRVIANVEGKEFKFSLPKWSVWLWAAVFLLALAIPSERAIYLMAASQMGEKVITDPATAEMMRDVREIISSNLKEMKGKP